MKSIEEASQVKYLSVLFALNPKTGNFSVIKFPEAFAEWHQAYFRAHRFTSEHFGLKRGTHQQFVHVIYKLDGVVLTETFNQKWKAVYNSRIPGHVDILENAGEQMEKVIAPDTREYEVITGLFQ